MRAYYTHSFALNQQDDIDLQTCLAKFKKIEVLRRGIQECLNDCPKPPKRLLEKVRKLIPK